MSKKKPESAPEAEAPRIPESIADLRAAKYNPRRIGAEAMAGLRTSLHEFGDISGIVWNRRSGNLVCGHQRIEGLKVQYGAAVRLVNEGGESVVLAGPHRFPVRIVDWPDQKEMLANVAANNHHIAGDFTDDLQSMIQSIDSADMAALIEPLRIDQLLPDEGSKPISLNTKAPPKFAFALIGIEITRWGEVAELVQQIAAIDGVRIETTITDKAE